VAVTALSVKMKHPEFDNVADATVVLYITQAENCHDSTVWGDLYDDGVEYKTCDLLARSPYARNLRLVNEGDTTIYQYEWERMRNQVGAAYRMPAY